MSVPNEPIDSDVPVAHLYTPVDERTPDSFNLDLSCMNVLPGNGGNGSGMFLKGATQAQVGALDDDTERSTAPSDAAVPPADVAVTWYGRVWAKCKELAATVMPFGGFVSSCFTFCTVTLGGGIIGMPSAFHTSGIVMGVIYLVVVTFLTVYSMVILGYAMEKTGLDSFENMAHGVFGRGGDYFVGFVLWLSCIGTAIAYISGVSSCVYPILHHESAPAYLKTDSGNRLITAMIWLAFMCPLIIPKHVNSLRYFSAFSVIFVLFFVLAVVIHSGTNGLKHFDEHKSEIRIFNTNGAQAIDGLGIFIFAFLCQGVCFPVRFEMRPKPTMKKLTLSSAVSMVICMVFYLLAGLFGYLDFGAKVEGSILYNYDPAKEPIMMFAYICILIKLCTAYAMNMIPVRNFVYYCLKWEIETIAYWKHILLITFVSVVVLVLGLFIPSIDMAFSLVGGTCGGFIAFIFPALFWMYSGKWTLRSVGIFHYCMTYFLIVVGVVAIVFSTAACLYYQFFHSDNE